jgi:hypothetical protein
MCFSALWSASDAQQTMAEIAAHMHAETKRRMECTGTQARDAIAAGPTGMLPAALRKSAIGGNAAFCGSAAQQAGDGSASGAQTPARKVFWPFLPSSGSREKSNANPHAVCVKAEVKQCSPAAILGNELPLSGC